LMKLDMDDVTEIMEEMKDELRDMIR
jgi:hypothetical protein